MAVRYTIGGRVRGDRGWGLPGNAGYPLLVWYISQFNCMTLSWWPCHKIVSVTFTHLHLHLLWVSNEPDNIKILSKSPILTARGAPYHIKGKIHRACVQRVSTCWAETGATMAENLKSVRNDRAYDGEMCEVSFIFVKTVKCSTWNWNQYPASHLKTFICSNCWNSDLWKSGTYRKPISIHTLHLRIISRLIILLRSREVQSDRPYNSTVWKDRSHT